MNEKNDFDKYLSDEVRMRQTCDHTRVEMAHRYMQGVLRIRHNAFPWKIITRGLRYFFKQLSPKIFTTACIAVAACTAPSANARASRLLLLHLHPIRHPWETSMENPLAVDSWRNSLGIRRHRLEWWQTACTAKHTIAPWWLRLQVRPMARG